MPFTAIKFRASSIPISAFCPANVRMSISANGGPKKQGGAGEPISGARTARDRKAHACSLERGDRVRFHRSSDLGRTFGVAQYPAGQRQFRELLQGGDLSGVRSADGLLRYKFFPEGPKDFP